MLILRKLVEQVFLRKFRSVFFFCSKVLRNSESRHNRGMVDGIIFYFIENFQCIAQSFGYVRKEFIHLFTCFHPLLFGIKHTGRVIQILAGTQTDQTVVRFRIFLVHKMNVVRTNQFYVVLLGILHQVFIHFYLHWITLVIGTGNGRFMALHLQIKVISE